MKKVLSVILAVLMLFSVFSTLSFAGNQTQSAVESADIGKYMLADSIYYFPDSVTALESGAFEGAGAKAVCFTGEAVSLPESTGLDKNAVIIINNAAKDSKGNDAKFGAANTGCKWFAFDVLSFFGKTVLAFFYEPVLNDDTVPCIEKLIEEAKPDYIYFESLNGKSSFYAKGNAPLQDIIDGNADANPGFIVNILMNFYTGLLEPKDKFYKNPGLNAFAAIIMGIFRKKK